MSQKSPTVLAASFQERLRVIKTSLTVTQTHSIDWGSWPSEVSIRNFAHDLYEEFTPDSLISRSRISSERPFHNWQSDDVYLDGERSGILLGLHCFGALPGDGVDLYVHILLPDETYIEFYIGMDYTQSTLEFLVGGHHEERVTYVAQTCAEAFGELRKKSRW